MKVRRKKGYFSISAVAKMFSVHQQTIRTYEKQGFVTPKRSTGNTRLFSEEDIDRLEEIIYLTHELGINLAGVEMIIKLKKQIDKMQKDMNNLFDDAQKTLIAEEEETKHAVQKSAHRLLEIKQEQNPQESAVGPPQLELVEDEESDDEQKEDDDWKIEYEE